MAYTHHRFSVAPMLDWTDRHCRYFHRLMTRHSLLYTEMVTTGAILRGKGDYLAFAPAEQPLALQLGGSNPQDLATCAQLAAERGYQEINLNAGCPSDRVQNGRFGACLMTEPLLVAECVDRMKQASNLPITVKTRIGIDEHDDYDFLKAFVEPVAAAGANTLIIHARKAWLKGLSPKENREIPPLNYERVRQLKCDYPKLHIVLNGGILTIEDAKAHLAHFDGVMLGRAAYQNPGLLLAVDPIIFEDQHHSTTAVEVVHAMLPYIEEQLQQGHYLSHITRHMLGLFSHQTGARAWRRHLSEYATKPGADVKVVLTALNYITQSL